ncbi:hypothetical protein UFOVP95_32 [uncultured Caudovirales phage]|uniref:DUF6378 domain-containing protein n=1 Tax=uncultured Caudovirales phage TaxID=2100421 RepID=A0A6J5L6T3_9CAUD|nr:hypothetical protein UFOVP95_32 [uncultured Caudovirales phage]
MACDLCIDVNFNMGTNKMNHTDVLAEAVRILRERDTKYGDVQEMFERTAKLASIILDKTITPYEITVILKCMKDARKKNDRLNLEHYADNINYEAFTYQLATSEMDQENEDAVIAAIAKKFAPELTNEEEYNV